MVGYRRYVAIGDSQTEGLWDGDESTGIVGFADRLATMLDAVSPGLMYANLAIRGKRIANVLAEQVPAALEMRPDVMTVCVGMNDVIRPGRAFDRAMVDLDHLHERLAESGATVVTTTFPDISRLLPVGRFLGRRLVTINESIRSSASHFGFRVVDLYGAPSMMEPGTWADDRVHGSTQGHMLFAAAAAEALGLPSSNHDWAHAKGDAAEPSFRERTSSQLQWTRNMMAPWVWRHIRGKSIGDGRAPKRPHLDAVRWLEAEN